MKVDYITAIVKKGKIYVDGEHVPGSTKSDDDVVIAVCRYKGLDADNPAAVAAITIIHE